MLMKINKLPKKRKMVKIFSKTWKRNIFDNQLTLDIEIMKENLNWIGMNKKDQMKSLKWNWIMKLGENLTKKWTWKTE